MARPRGRGPAEGAAESTHPSGVYHPDPRIRAATANARARRRNATGPARPPPGPDRPETGVRAGSPETLNETRDVGFFLSVDVTVFP
jgi:hypothetical protein